LSETTTSWKELVNLPGLLRNLISRREIIRILTWRDFAARFRGSVFGVLWAFLQPLFMMVVYTLVFSVFLKVRFGSSESPYTFAVYLLCGLLPWNTFAEGLNSSTDLIRKNANLVKRVVFPLEVLPLNLTLVLVIQQLIGFVLLLPLAYIISGTLGWALLFMPVILLFQILFVTGANWIWASISVFVPDLRQATTLLTMLLMFVTPIFYPEDLIPARFQWLITLNPIARLVSMYRDVVMSAQLPSLPEILGTGAVCLVVFMFGYVWFMRTKAIFADIV
jgi:lipopolysaccharide transport system permease protein